MKLVTLVMRLQLTCRRERQKSNEVKFSVIKNKKPTNNNYLWNPVQNYMKENNQGFN
jgi:ABC-type phosphate/phosphonate transport system substrate-binding protein